MLGGLRKLPGCGAEWPAVGGSAGAGWERMDLPSSGAQWMGNLQRNPCRSSSAGPAPPRFLHCPISCPSPNFPFALPNCSMQTSWKGCSLTKIPLHPPYPPFIFCSPFPPLFLDLPHSFPPQCCCGGPEATSRGKCRVWQGSVTGGRPQGGRCDGRGWQEGQQCPW